MAKGHAVKLVIVEVVVLVLGLFLFFTACSKAQSLTPSLLITEVQTQSADSKTEEFIELYNPTDQDINLDTLEVSYFSAASENGSPFTLTPSLSGTSLKSRGYLLIKQADYVLNADTSFSGGLNDAGGHIQISLGDEVIDTLGWGSAAYPETQAAEVVEAGSSLSRKIDGDGRFQDTNNNSADFLEAMPSPTGGGLVEDVQDVCPNLPDLQTELPEDYQLNETGDCVSTQPCRLEISEVSAQPNLNAQEYIEFYNSSTEPALASLCSVSINGGAERGLPEEMVKPSTWLVISFASGVIRNSAGQVVLTRSSTDALTYNYPESYSGQTVNFRSGSYVGELSDQPTPGAANQTILSEDDAGSGSGGELTDCPAGKYRNPETNRCKSSEAAIAELTPCDEGEERNPATNRCRKVAITASSLTPCDAGEERNPATNRCRKAIAISTDLKACEPGQERNPETNRCRKVLSAAATGAALPADASQASNGFKFGLKIILLVLATLLAYGAYEYRTDLKNLYQKIRSSRTKGHPPG